MATFQQKLSEIEARIEASQEAQRKLCKEIEEAKEEKNRLIAAEEVKSSGLSSEEIYTFRRALTIMANLLNEEICLLGSFKIVDEEPDVTDGGYTHKDEPLKYSFSITQAYVNDVCPGLRTTIILKTKEKGIKAIVHEMLEQKGFREPDADEFPDYWYRDWDYYQTIEIRNPITKKEYFTDMNRFY